jgi:predicted  nucleic acid-binding Zn-ribbon protein
MKRETSIVFFLFLAPSSFILSHSTHIRRGASAMLLRMTRWLMMIALCLLPSLVMAQYPVTQLTSVFPFGGKLGSTIEVTITGTDLDDAEQLVFSHPGITAKPKAAGRTFDVTINPDVPRGFYEVRVRGLYGLSNPRMFAVDRLTEVTETEPNNPREQAQAITLNTIVNGRCEAEKPDCFKVPLEAGQRVLVECLAFRADSQLDGALVIYDEAGNELARTNDVLRRDPLLDLTVPKSGTYTIELYDFLYKGGDNYAYRLSVSNQPRVDFVFPPMGQPGSKSKYTLYGRNLPGGEKTEHKTVDGTPLEKLSVEIELPATAAVNAASAMQLEAKDQAGECFVYYPQWGEVAANPVPIYYTQQPLVLEAEPNNDPATAQKITIPCDIAGQFQQRKDQDFYTFEATKGETLWFEVLSERLGQNTDPYLIVQRVTKNEQGVETVNEVAGVDESQKATPQQQNLFDISHADVVHKLVVPETGTYRVVVRDLYFQSRGNPQFLYRLSIRRPTPDFKLIAVAEAPKNQQDGNKINLWSPVLHRGGTQGVRVYLQRQDDFNGQVRVNVTGLPEGVTCPDLLLGGDANMGTLIFSAKEDAAPWSGTIQITGTSTLGDKEVQRRAAVGTVIWGTADRNQNPARSRMAGDMTISVINAETQPVTIELGTGTMLETAVAGKLEIPVKVTRRGDFKEPLKLAPVNLPKDIKLAEVDIAADKNEGKIVLDIKNSVVPGEYSFVLQTSSKINNYRRNPAAVEKMEKAKTEVAESAKALDEKLKAATTAKQAADKEITDATAAVTKATAELKQAQTELQSAEAKAKSANEQAAAAEKAASEKTDDEALKKAAADAKQAAQAANDGLKAVQDNIAKLDQAVKAAQDKLNAVNTNKSAAEQAIASATQAKAELDKTKVDVEKRLKEVQDISKPKNINVVFYSQPVQVKIQRSPVEVQLDKATLEVKPGQKGIELVAKVNRLYGFDDEVRLSLAQNDALGFKVINTAVAKGANDGKLAFDVSDKTKPGDYSLTIKVAVTYNTQPVTFDLTVPVKVVE